MGELHRQWRRTLAVSAALLGVMPAAAQYQLHHLADFEEGRLSPDTATIGPTADKTIQIVELNKVAGMPPSFRSGQGGRETGRYALKLNVTPNPADFKTNSTGISVGEILDRDKLGAAGRALYQADFYLGGDPSLANLAVLAMEPPDDTAGAKTKTVETVRKPFYRFGITKSSVLYFSSFFPDSKEKAIFVDDPELMKQIPRPGWHRFAIVMEGAETIRCFVDGREAGFSPIKDKHLRKLLVGVMLASPAPMDNAYADNLSIQFSPDAASMPDSPYQEGWQLAAGTAADRNSGVAPAPAATPVTGASGTWLEPIAAWERARAERKPLLLYFYAPGLAGTKRMDDILASDPKAQSFVATHSPARVDINQLQGGKIAKQYQVFKVPSFIVIAADQSTYKRSTPARDAAWEQIEADLRLK